MFGTLNPQEIEEFLKKQFIGRIGCHADGKTYVVPISYAYDGKNIYCHTQEGMKIKMMRENPSVCFEVDTLETMATWKSVIGYGSFQEITDKEERAKALHILLSRVYPFISSKKMQLGEHWPFEPDDPNEIKGVVFKIHLSEKTGRCEINEDPWYYNKVNG
ncbi:MAG: pyridoxamine 5'-phosphate oxidase family protein [Bacteroidetes bacterium]|nr:pyridoxamine 5'-phosphate oxidase family protein [Bacteroidota bacterium]